MRIYHYYIHCTFITPVNKASGLRLFMHSMRVYIYVRAEVFSLPCYRNKMHLSTADMKLYDFSPPSCFQDLDSVSLCLCLL